MPQFFLIDPWLADAKGHNYQYALDVAHAAHRRGYAPVLGVRKHLSREARFPAAWRVETLFPHGECPGHWLSLDGRNRYPYGLDGKWLPDSSISWWKRVLDLPRRFDRQRRIASFVQSCVKLFGQVPARDEDLLYFPSLSEFDFLCAVRFWRDHAWTQALDWHLQFHFNFFGGRDPEYSEQTDVLYRFQRLFREAVDQIPQHRLHFYATTEAIARQYDALGVAIFRPLPYPVRPLRDAAQAVPPASADRPLRVTLPGAMRREKGKKRLGQLIERTWDEFLESGRAQFILQANPRQIEQWLPGRLRGKVHVPAAGTSDPRSPLLATAHPLDEQQYAKLIQQSDIGLFVYDARRYFARASGVLCEMLSAGVPVMVPAGCWLADQIAEENYRYIESLWRQHGEVQSLEVALDSLPVTELPAAARTVLMRFHWPNHTQPGTYAELTVHPADEAQEVGTAVQREVLSWREAGQAGVMFHFQQPVTRLKITLCNAYDGAPLAVPTLQLLPLPLSADEKHPPLGAIGLTAANDQQIPRLLRDLILHHGHYVRMALRHAPLWQSQHSPAHTISQLESRTHGWGTRQRTNAA